MREVVIQIPTFETEQNIEIDVKINGRKRTLKYRVEIVEWDVENPEPLEKVQTIRRVVREHEKDWELVQIGSPTEKNIPVMFRKKQKKEMV
jgi:hypothetical protein